LKVHIPGLTNRRKAMNATGIHHLALASVTIAIQRFFKGLRAWHAERRDRRVLDSLSEELLKDIGFRRVPTDPPSYQRLGDGSLD
jgi:uncharacterized protein YjiS (DUF1127 family)